jgi:CRP-like cAMP-binding protein
MNVLRPNTLLATLVKADEQSLFGSLSMYNADKHTRLHRAGEQVEHVYFPLAGMISLLTVMSDGVAVETAAVGYDSAAGFNGALSGRNANCEAIVQISMQSLRIARRPFLNAYDSSPGVRRMIHVANEMLVEQIQQVAACHALHNSEGRLARWLLQTHDYAGSDLLDLTQDFVSEMIGVRRTTVTELAQTLQREGLIKYSRGRVTIVNRKGLEQRCCECYQTVAEARAANPPLKPPSVAPSQA